ncbi:MAG: hypothetical protein ABIX37_10275 [Gammaproteobacteria bacterium]
MVSLAATAQVAPAPPPSGSSTTWNASTATPPPRPPTEDSTLSLRIYGGDKVWSQLPYQAGPRRRDDPAWAADVSAVMTRCADGNLLITALVIGGQLTPLDNHCPDTAKPLAPQCDAKTWNCGPHSAD